MASTTDTNDHSGNEGARKTARMKDAFNARAKSVHEVEIKELVIGNDRSVFDKIERFFTDSGYVCLTAKNKQLQTRQLDTPDRALLAKGKTLRIRGECVNGDLSRVSEADICVKDDKTTTASGAVKRNEYEARIRSFETATLRPLLEKYPKKDYADLHETLRSLRVRDLREYFRIDCIRNRYVIELPEEITGIKGKRFIGELIMDDVAFMMDLQGRAEPLVYHHDLEVECEVLFKPCSYDANPEAAKNFVSSPDLTREEVDMGLRALKNLLRTASGNRLTYNVDSKAERGFSALDATLAGISKYLAPAQKSPDRTPARLTPAFGVVQKQARDQANDNTSPSSQADLGSRLHKLLPRSMAHVVRERPIARRPMP